MCWQARPGASFRAKERERKSEHLRLLKLVCLPALAPLTQVTPSSKVVGDLAQFMVQVRRQGGGAGFLGG